MERGISSRADVLLSLALGFEEGALVSLQAQHSSRRFSRQEQELEKCEEVLQQTGQVPL